MARKIYGNLDLADNQLLNITLQSLAGDPANVEAKLYYNSATKKIRYYDGTAWRDLTDSSVAATKADKATTVTAGAGLTGGGDLSANRSVAVGAGTGITVNADDVAVNRTTVDAWYEAAGAVAAHAIASDPHTEYQKESEKGAANGYAPLDANSLIPTTHIPPLAINETFVVVSQAAMLALTAQRGDMAIRTDNGKTYVLATDSPSTLADWKEVQATGQVVSVNGSTGVVVITLASLGGVPDTRTIAAGNGLTGGGTLAADRTLTVQAADASINVAAGGVSVASAPKWTTPRSITLTGDVTGSTTGVDGSGNISIATTAAAGGKRYAAALAASTSQVINHNLNTRDVVVSVYNLSSPYDEIFPDIQHTSVNSVTVVANPAIPAGYGIVVLG